MHVGLLFDKLYQTFVAPGGLSTRALVQGSGVPRAPCGERWGRQCDKMGLEQGVECFQGWCLAIVLLLSSRSLELSCGNAWPPPLHQSYGWALISVLVAQSVLGPAFSTSCLGTRVVLATECSGWGCPEVALQFIQSAVRAAGYTTPFRCSSASVLASATQGRFTPLNLW
jgi:hypothetical protein